jgi:hypothetical protein
MKKNNVVVEGFYVPVMYEDMDYILAELAILASEEIIEVIVEFLKAGNIQVTQKSKLWNKRLSNLFKSRKKEISYDSATHGYLQYMNEHKERIKGKLL